MDAHLLVRGPLIAGALHDRPLGRARTTAHNHHNHHHQHHSSTPTTTIIFIFINMFDNKSLLLLHPREGYNRETYTKQGTVGKRVTMCLAMPNWPPPVLSISPLSIYIEWLFTSHFGIFNTLFPLSPVWYRSLYCTPHGNVVKVIFIFKHNCDYEYDGGCGYTGIVLMVVVVVAVGGDGEPQLSTAP